LDVDRAADALLREGERPTIERIRARLGRGSPNTINPLLDAWWSGTEMALDARVMTVGPILEVLSTPIIPAALVSVALSGADWRSLITPSSSFELTAQPVLMALNWAAYRRIEAALVAELEDGLKAAIRTTQLDLDPHPTAEALT